MKRLILTASAVAGTILCAHGADAALVTITYSGVLSQGFDTSGVFGAANTDLTGAAFETQYLVDTSIGQSSTDPTRSLLQGGFDYPSQSPVLSVTLTINGHQYVSDGIAIGRIEDIAREHYSQQFSYAEHFSHDDVGDRFSKIYNYAWDGRPFYPLSLEAPFSTEITTPWDGGFTLSGHTYANPGLSTSASGSFRNQFLTIAVVPEPASWAMFIGGFGLVGASLRRRQRTIVRFA